MNWYELNSMAGVYGWRAAVTASGGNLKRAGSPGLDRSDVPKCLLPMLASSIAGKTRQSRSNATRASLARAGGVPLPETKSNRALRRAIGVDLHAEGHFSFNPQHVLDCHLPLLASRRPYAAAERRWRLARSAHPGSCGHLQWT